jgi:hypothetical protein
MSEPKEEQLLQQEWGGVARVRGRVVPHGYGQFYLCQMCGGGGSCGPGGVSTKEVGAVGVRDWA